VSGEKLHCPRDGTTLISPEETNITAFSRHGIFHCPECAGLALHAKAAASAISAEKLEHLHDGFTDQGAPVEISCPFCKIGMRVRDFAFRKLDGTLTELIEIDGCPSCSSFWLDASELQRISPTNELDPSEPSLFPAKTTGAEANTLAIVLEVLFHLPFVLI
jgi:Zn-finger nucleic acid-binding protein